MVFCIYRCAALLLCFIRFYNYYFFIYLFIFLPLLGTLIYFAFLFSFLLLCVFFLVWRNRLTSHQVHLESFHHTLCRGSGLQVFCYMLLIKYVCMWICIFLRCTFSCKLLIKVYYNSIFRYSSLRKVYTDTLSHQ